MSPVFEALRLTAIGAALVLPLMLATWIVSVRLRNAGYVDVSWALGLGSLAALYGALGSGDRTRRLAILAMGAIWGLRLAWHLVKRVSREPEDGRYQELRREWGANADRKLLAFFLFQGVLDLFLALPFLLAAINPAPGLGPFEIAGIALWMVSLTGESLADAQLRRFKSDPRNRGRTCQVGLWRYSRHPNYFFEWLVWCAYALFAAGSPWGALATLCPALMLYFLLRVTGIPATEAQALRSRGEEYREYQRTTSAFVPWFRKDRKA